MASKVNSRIIGNKDSYFCFIALKDQNTIIDDTYDEISSKPACCWIFTSHNPYSNAGVYDGAIPRQAVQLPEGSYFIYTGATALTAKGVITGTVYRFEQTGSRLEVDRRDAPFMTGIPNLRKLQRGE